MPNAPNPPPGPLTFNNRDCIRQLHQGYPTNQPFT
uniref:Uncharacterized protein n=1 Tax=Arundo donax TaxID=35708 RepID=A0A0A9BP35_ARUDO